MLWGEFRDVPNLAVDYDPAIVDIVVFRDLLDGDERLLSHFHSVDNGSQQKWTTQPI